MIQWIKKNYIFFIVFLFVFCLYSFLSFPNHYGDPFVSYGFSYAIIRGEIPYLDFNTISTPLYSFVMAVGLLLWNNYTMFILEQTFLVTIMFYLLYQIYGKKCFLLFSTIIICSCFGINATYNYMAFFCMILLLYLEEKHPDKDYLIGFCIMMAILSKQTVGVLLVLPTFLYYWKDKKKIFRRFIGCLIPGLVFLLYLVVTKSFSSFFDLCLFGLLDFSSHNGKTNRLWFYISVVCFLLSLFICIKKKKDIKNYYLLMGISFVIPLFDFNHFSIYAMCLTLQFLPFLRRREGFVTILLVSFSIFYQLIIFTYVCSIYSPVLNQDFSRFQYTLNGKYNYERSKEDYEFFDTYPDALLLTYGKTQYDISRDKDIDYYNVFLYGNFGYHGEEKMISKIKKLHNTYIIVDMDDYLDERAESQFDKEIAKYVMDHYPKVDSKLHFDVYYKE